MITVAVAGVTGRQPPRRQRLHLDDGQALLTGEWGSITRHDFTAKVLIPGTRPVRD